jgi:predicted metal-dependent HD superfamily phosphohydrolase
MKRWSILWSNLGARSEPDVVLEVLLQAYAGPQRAYHTFDHIIDCLARFDLSSLFAQNPLEVEAALWFHDVVYDPRAHDNEERSAAWAGDVLARGEVPVSCVDRIRSLILATRHQSPPDDADAALIVDIDLSILGRDPATFERYEQQIRKEYAHVPDEAFRQGRLAILESFLQRDLIYQTPLFREKYEAQARENLNGSIRRLRS